MKIGQSVIINESQLEGHIVGIDDANFIYHVEVNLPSGKEVIPVLQDAVTIIGLVRSILPLLMEIWYFLFPSKRVG